MQLKDKVAVVTGARGGMGRAIVERFLDEAATVYSLDLSELGSVREHADDGSRFLRVDVTSEADVQSAFRAVREDSGRLDVLVNAAAIKLDGTAAETTLDQWNRTFAVNVTGTFLMSKHALPLLHVGAERSGSVSLINIGSYDGYIADPGLAAYCASKGAVLALTRAMACDHGPDGIRVNAICPGYIDTPMLRSHLDPTSPKAEAEVAQWQEAVRGIHPTRQYGTPEDVASLTTWLASDEARMPPGSSGCSTAD